MNYSKSIESCNDSLVKNEKYSVLRSANYRWVRSSWLTCEISSCWCHQDPLRSRMLGWWTCALSAAHSPAFPWFGWLPHQLTCPRPLPQMVHFAHGSGSHKFHLMSRPKDFAQDNWKTCNILLFKTANVNHKAINSRKKLKISHRFLVPGGCNSLGWVGVGVWAVEKVQ